MAEQVRDPFMRLNAYKTLDPNNMHAKILKELDNVVAFHHIWKVMDVRWSLGDRKKGNIASAFQKCRKEDPGIYRSVVLISVPEKVMEQIILEIKLRHTQVKEMIWDYQYDCHSKGRWQAWSRPMINLIQFTRPSVRCSAWVRAIPDISTNRERTHGEQCCGEGLLW